MSKSLHLLPVNARIDKTSSFRTLEIDHDGRKTMKDHHAPLNAPIELKPREKLKRIKKVRETPFILEALSEEARLAGVSQYEALRQLLTDFVARPFPLVEEFYAPLSENYGSVRCDGAVVEAFGQLAAQQGMTVSEATRAVVRHFLKSKGRL